MAFSSIQIVSIFLELRTSWIKRGTRDVSRSVTVGDGSATGFGRRCFSTPNRARTGIDRKTVRKMLLHECPQPYSRAQRYPKLGPHTETIDQLAGANARSPPECRLSVAEIYRHLQNNEGYAGSYGAVNGYLTENFGSSRHPHIEIWNDAYELIVSLDKSSAVDFMRMISSAEGPLFSPSRVQKVFGEAVKLMKSRSQVGCPKSSHQ